MSKPTPEQNRAWKDNNPNWRDAQKAKAAKILADLKEGVPCADCGGLFPDECMDFDHLPGETKVRNVSALVRGGWSLEKIYAEVEKCELVCANCHRIRTKKRLNEG